MTQHEDWLNMTREDPLEPGLLICDPHHHLWDYPETLPEDKVPPFVRRQRHYLLNGLLQDISGGHNISKTVFIECNSMYKKDGPTEMRCVGETEFVQGVAAQSASGQYGGTAVASGIVGFADLTLGSAVASVLEAHIKASPNRFRGIRYISTWDLNREINSRVKSPGLFSDARFREGFACLQKYNLSFDTWLYHTQLTELVDLAKAFPEIIELESVKLASQAKSELLANVSHELRTPLASIKGNIESLLETDVEWSKKQQLEFLQSADSEADRLTLLIRDLLDMSRIDSGKLTLDKRSYLVSDILDSISRVLSMITKKHKLKITTMLDLPPLQADKIRIGQVITNLAENATKFSAEGSQIEIKAKLNESYVIISVADNGIGMQPDVVANLFNRFYQAKLVVQGKTRGTGLGLAICKGIVEAHGGKIWVESQVGKGSTFRFSIPLSS